MVFLWALASVVIVSLLSLLGALFLVVKKETLNSVISYAIGISSGVLLGTVFFELLPESYAEIGKGAYISVLAGIVSFFALEKLINWHHCTHQDKHKEKPVAYLSLIGDGIHNFIDGAVMAVAYITSIPLGVTTTIAVIAHEIPHEIGDFTILLYGGLKKSKALLYNLLSALTAVVGTLLVFVFSEQVRSFSPYFIGFTAGNFIYIATSDLLPELHEHKSVATSLREVATILFGIVVMWVLTTYIGE